MAHRDLRDFISRIDELGELHVVPAEVDPCLEIAAITNRVSKLESGGPALLFSKVKGGRFRVAANLFGSEKRVAAALCLESLDALPARLREVMSDTPGETAAERLASLAITWAGERAKPVRSKDPFCQEVKDRITDLRELPVPKSWPLDGVPDHGGRFITLPLVITRGPGGGLNCGMYRVALLGPDTFAIHWDPASGGAAHAAAWGSKGAAMPVAIAVGGPPALTFAAMLPLPEALDEFVFAGLLQGEPVETVRCLTSDLVVPAGAELVIEGVMEPGENARDGAFGNHTGYYQPSSVSPMVRVTAITHRHDMIYPTTVVGPPPMEDCWLAAAAGRLFLALLRIDMPEVTSLHQPLTGIFHGGTVVAVRNGSGRGEELIARIRATPWFSRSRMIVLVDEEQDPSDAAGVYWRVMNNVEWEHDLVIDAGCLGVDATAKPSAGSPDLIPVRMDENMMRQVEKRWQEYGFSNDK